MAKTQTTTTRAAAAAAAAATTAAIVAALPTATATSNATATVAVAPAAAVLAAARTSAQQARAWHTTSGSTMPTANLPLACGPVAPKGKPGGPRHQHGTALRAACVALGTTATVATVAAWCKANGSKWGTAAPLAGAAGNVRCALGQGVLVVPVA